MNFLPYTVDDFEKFNNLKPIGIHLHTSIIQESRIFDHYVVGQDRNLNCKQIYN